MWYPDNAFVFLFQSDPLLLQLANKSDLKERRKVTQEVIDDMLRSVSDQWEPRPQYFEISVASRRDPVAVLFRILSDTVSR